MSIFDFRSLSINFPKTIGIFTALILILNEHYYYLAKDFGLIHKNLSN